MHIPGYVLEQMQIILLISAILAFPLAWVAEYAVGDRGFVVIGNFIVLGLGGVAGVIFLMVQLGRAGSLLNVPHIPFLGGAGGAIVTLMVACLFKRFMMR